MKMSSQQIEKRNFVTTNSYKYFIAMATTVKTVK